MPGEDGPEDSAGSSVVFPSAVGAPSEQSVREALPLLPTVAGASLSASLGLPSSGSASATPSTVVSRRQRMKDQGFSDRVVERIEKSRVLSTKAHYKSQWDLFVASATDKGLDPLQASLPLLTDFLEYLFKVRQISVRTIKNYKSAISFYWKSLSDYEIPGDNQVVSDLFRGFARKRQVPRKHVVEWDVRLVLSFYQSGRFKDWGQLSDWELTLKMVFLLALATGKRRSELHALSHEVRWINADVRSPDFLSMTHVATNGLGAFQPVVLRSLDSAVGQDNSEDKLLCPVRTLSFYLQRSGEYGSPEQKRLFILYRRGAPKVLSKQSVSRHIREAVSLAYSEKNQTAQSRRLWVLNRTLLDMSPPRLVPLRIFLWKTF